MSDEFRTASAAIAYPFSDDAAAVADGTFPGQLLVDALVTVPRSLADARVYVRSASVSAEAMTLTVGSDAEAWVTLTLSPGTDAWTTASASADGVTVTVLADTAALADALATAPWSREYGTGLPFTAAALAADLAGVRTLDICNAGPAGGFTRVQGTVSLRPGYNMAVADIGGGFELAAVAGAGLGRSPCTGSGTRQGMPGLVPDNGNVQVVGDGCYEVVPVPSQGMFILQSRCEACCKCDDYVAARDRLAEFAGTMNDLKTALDAALARYRDALAAYSDTLLPAAVSGRLALTGSHGPVPGQTLPGGMTMYGPVYWTWVITYVNTGRRFATLHNLALAFKNSVSLDITDKMTVLSAALHRGTSVDQITLGADIADVAPGDTVTVVVETRMTRTNWTDLAPSKLVAAVATAEQKLLVPGQGTYTDGAGLTATVSVS